MNDGRLDLVQIFQSVDRLDDDRPGFFLRKVFVLFEIEIQVVAFTVFHHSTEPGTGEVREVSTAHLNKKKRM